MNKMKRRSRLEIYLDVLRSVYQSGKPTRIGNRANLSWKDALKYLNFLELQGFVGIVKETSGRKEYKLTQKGFEALDALQKIAEALAPKLRA